MDIIVLIPARLESSRLPGKALKDIGGIPAIVHTYSRCLLASEIKDVFVCTDSREIAAAIKKVNGKVIMTKEHKNGSERIYEASLNFKTKNFINVQGDEILVNPDHINLLAKKMKLNTGTEFFIGHTFFSTYQDTSSFKSVLDKDNQLLFCSREDIPSPAITGRKFLKKTVFIIGFRNNSLERFVTWGECDLERSEPNEFLRILYNGYSISSIEMNDAKISLDTPEDLEVIRSLLKKDQWFENYEKYTKLF